MRVFSQETMDRICRQCGVENLGEATIMDSAKVAAALERESGTPVIHMEMGSPGFAINRYGAEAEKAALDAGVGSRYAPTGGLPVLKNAASRFAKAFLNLDLDPLCFFPTTGSMLGAFCAFAAASQRLPDRRDILVLEPSFSANKQQFAILGIGWKGFEVSDFRGAKLREKLESELGSGRFTAMVYSNPNNPSWMCLDEEELATIAKVAAKYDVIVIEDLAYFCMDFRTPGLGIPYTEPYPPTVARFGGRYMLLQSASKIFSYAGQRVGTLCVSPELYHTRYPALAERYKTTGEFGPTLADAILDMVTSGTTASTQYGYAEMLNLSCDGVINFVEDTREYARRASRMKEIFVRHGFGITYDKDLGGEVGDGFFFTVSYPGFSSGALMGELLAYGVSSVSLNKMGSARAGVRVCSSRIKDDQFGLLEKRMADFEQDHPSD